MKKKALIEIASFNIPIYLLRIICIALGIYILFQFQVDSRGYIIKLGFLAIIFLFSAVSKIKLFEDSIEFSSHRIITFLSTRNSIEIKELKKNQLEVK